MKKLLVSFLLLLLFFANSSLSTAHSGPPFISVNGTANQPNPAASGSVFFKVPNEIAVGTHLINQTLNFTIDTNLLPVPPESVKTADFLWEFGNGQAATGLSASTKYSKPGSYVVLIKVKDPNYQEAVELETMQVNILPKQDYQLPKAIIKVNGQTITDPFTQAVGVGKEGKVTLDGSSSTGKIKSYKWDLGDDTALTTDQKVEHTYNFSQPYAYTFFPLLRVEDDQGLYSDAIAQISNEEPTTASSSAQKNNLNFLPFAIATVVILVVGGSIFYLATQRKISQKRK